MRRRSVLTGLMALIGTVTLQRAVRAQTRPEVLAFHYGWYGPDEGWGTSADGGRNHPNRPVGGRYDSLDPAVIARQIAQARAAGITGFITSWDGQDNRRDRVFQALLAAAPEGFAISAYFESAGGSPQTLADRLAHLSGHLSASPRALRLQDRPCVFVFDRVLQEIGEAGWAEARPRDLAVVGPANSEAEITTRRSLFEALHVYSMQFHTDGWWVGFEYQARRWLSRWVGWQRGLAVTTATVLPGYDDRRLDDRTGDRPTTQRRDGRTFQMMLRAARAARPDWLLIVSWNEWFEATEIEPSREDGTRALDTMRAVLGLTT